MLLVGSGAPGRGRPQEHGRQMTNKDALRLPVVSLSAEYLTIGCLMRRNILAYKAPPNNEGYDLICIHPDTKKSSTTIRIQVKSRYQTDSDRAFPVNEKTFGGFDYLIVVFLNIGYFFSKSGRDGGNRPPEFYTLPRAFIEKHHYRPVSGFQKVRTRGLDISLYKDDVGFEQIASDLKIPFPSRPA
jgi:hypothetical protein